MRMHLLKKSSFLFAAMLVAVFFMLLPLPACAQNGLSLVSSSALEKIYEWQAPEWQWQTVVIDGQTFLRPDSAGGLFWSQPGAPLLPMATMSLDLQPGQQAEVVLSDTLYSTESVGYPLCPAPTIDPATGDLAYLKSARVDLPAGFIPEVSCQSSIGQARDRRILQITLLPLQYAPQSQTIRSLRYARITVKILPPAYPLLRPAQMTGLHTALQSSVKIYLVDEGPYAVSGSDLQAAGASIAGIAPRAIRLFNRGVEQAIEVEDGGDGRLDGVDQILFYARFRHGKDEFYDAYSDTNVYWLTWDGADGARYANHAVGASSLVVDSFPDTLHIEKDLYYYDGDSDNDIHNSERVSGEGWAWVLLNKGGSADLGFDLPSPAAGQDSLTLRMRLRGTTLDSHTPDHHVLIFLNGSRIHEMWFNDRSEALIDVRIPYALFRAGGNTIQVNLLADTPSERSQIYIDWLEIYYLRSAVAAQEWLNLPVAAGAEESFFVSGFAHASLKAWDLAQQRSYMLPAAGRMWRERLTVRSAGLADGDQAKLIRGGSEAASGFRGHNLWRIDALDGRLTGQKNFDTYGSKAQADSMAAWIQRLPDGALVAAAIRDEGSASMTEAAYLALESLGSAMTRSVGARDSWALFGHKGAIPGSVPEVLRKSKSGAAIIDTLMVYPGGGSSFSTDLALPADAGNELAVFSRNGLKSPARLSLYKSADLLSGGAGADYLIITHPLFAEQARQLASYRASHNGWRTRVILVEQIYDEFNDGLADPAAIRAFLKHARDNWVKPAPAFALLLGDASWDPKNNYALEHPTEFVPTYGHPVSDSWFGCLDGPGDMLPDLHIGRIPAQTVAEAEASVAKILAYESTPSASWKKDFLFISGGFDFLEQNQFGQQTQRLIKEFVTPAPTCGRAIALNKTTDGLQEGEHRQEILDTIDDGAAWVNFIGHAGSRTWDLMFHNVDIEALGNSPRFPFVTSMTCHTGRFAEPNQVAFGEHFLLVADKGAIGFLGTSGWGYSYEDYAFLRKLFPAALKDTLRYLSAMIDVAKVQLWAEGAADAQVRDMLYQYNLLGDPALKLAVPEQPDLAVQPADIEIVPEMPSESDSTAQIRLHIHNFGLATRDSVAVRLLARHPNLGEREIAPLMRLPAIGRLDSINCSWPLHNMAGALELLVQVDPLNKIVEVDENNNATQRSVTVLSDRFQLVSPTQYALLPTDRPVFRVEEMNLLNAGKRYIEFEVDTSLTFTSPALQKSGRLALDQFSTSWQPAALQTDNIYFWSCKDVTNPESAHIVSGQITISRAARWGWRQATDFGSGIGKQVDLSRDAVLDTLHAELLAASGGLLDGNFAGIYINGKNIIPPGRGYSVVVFNPHTGNAVEVRKFDVYGNAAVVAEMAAFLDSIQSGYYVIAAVQDDGYFNSPDLLRAFESIGSLACREIGFRDSWAVIGIKGSAPGSARELLRKSKTGDAAVRDTLYYLSPRGTLASPRIGPAAAWRSLTAEASVPANCALTLSVLGQQRNSVLWDTLRTGLPANAQMDLSAISSYSYPSLQLVADFASSDQLATPRLSAWQVLHDPVPDLAVTPAFLSQSADSVLSGQPVVLKVDLFNIGLARADSVIVTFAETAAGSAEKIFSRVQLPKPMEADARIPVDQLYTPTGRPGSRLVTIRIDGENRINELSESNNTVSTRVQVVADTVQPQIAISFDGRTLAAMDWVAPQPLIQARIVDNSQLPITDTLAVNVLLDLVRLPFSGANAVQLAPLAGNQTQALLQFRPQLEEGDHTLEIIYADASGNRSSASIDFRVAASLKLLNVMNYPNPMVRQTDFTFELTQSADVRIRIYTVNGRLIRSIEAGTLGAGFNRVFWDGRDGDGDALANGVYLYRIDAAGQDERTEAIEKCIVMR